MWLLGVILDPLDSITNGIRRVRDPILREPVNLILAIQEVK
jgi:hypothetical protein